MIRPAVRALFRRWREAAAAVAVAGFGMWLTGLGGWLLVPLGLVTAALGAAWAVLALRRARFQADPGAPGIVEITEGRLRYLHPRTGGEIALHDLAELRLLRLRGRAVWGLSDLHGRRLLVPLDAAGAGALFDAFAALPGLASADLVAALGTEAPAAPGLPAVALQDRRVWTRPGSGLRPV